MIGRFPAGAGAGAMQPPGLIHEHNVDTGPEAPLPPWRVDFADEVNTSLYFSPVSSKRLAVRSDIWRRHDFFWILNSRPDPEFVGVRPRIC